jgi:L-threonylcarbamoyladenylate synthase
MVIVDYSKKHHREIINSCVHALRHGRIVAYPTDTSYGLAVDATNISAIKKLYKVKGRNFNKPVHIIPPNIGSAKKIVGWGRMAEKLAKRFWPGPLTFVLRLKAKGLGYRMLSAESGWLGIRMPKNQIALDLAKYLGEPITATSANRSGKPDSYSAADILSQFKKIKFKPDVIINAGKLRERKPSTVIRIDKNQIILLRKGPVSVKEHLWQRT